MQYIHDFDHAVIGWMRRYSGVAFRGALFVVYGWFGLLKVIGQSPATPLVAELQGTMLPFFDAGTFLVLFGLFEVMIGALFLVPRAERVAIAFLAFHMVTTTMPLVVLPHVVWSGFLVPTLEGQYIIKNIALIALAMGIAANLVSYRERQQ